MLTRHIESWMLIPRMHVEPVLARVCAVAFALTASATAFAQSIRVAVIHAPVQDEAARRLRAEVLAAGFDVVDVPVSPLEVRSTATIARAAGAVAALRIRAGRDLEMLVIDSDTGNALDSVVLPAEESTLRLEVRAVEDLRAKLVQLSIPIPPPTEAAPGVSGPTTLTSRPGPPPPTVTPLVLHDEAKVNSAVDHTLPREQDNAARGRNTVGVWLQAAAGGALSSGGLGDSAVSRVGVRVEASPRWSVAGLALLPLTGSNVVTERGSASVDAYVFGAMLGVAPLRSQTLEFELGLGAGAAFCRMGGVPTNPNDEGRSLSLWTGIGIGEMSVAWSAASWLRLRMAVVLGAAAPRAAVSFDGERVATWGRPLAISTVGIELAPSFMVNGGS